MAYTRIVTRTRPTGVQFWHQTSPYLAEIENDWVRSQPGFISKNTNFTDINTMVTTLTFTTKEAWQAMYDQLITRSNIITKKQHNIDVGITVTVQEVFN